MVVDYKNVCNTVRCKSPCLLTKELGILDLNKLGKYTFNVLVCIVIDVSCSKIYDRKPSYSKCQGSLAAAKNVRDFENDAKKIKATQATVDKIKLALKKDS